MARAFAAGQNLLVGNPTALQIIGTDFTVFARCQPTSLPASTQQVVAKRNANITTIAYELGFWNQKLRFAISDLATGYDFAESVGLGATPGRISVGGIKQGGSLRCYVSGVNAGSVSSSVDLHNSGANFRIGRDDQGNQFVGPICEVAVWIKALNDVEMAALDKGVCPLMIRRELLRGYWPIFGNAVPEVDLSGNRNHAAVAGTEPAYSPHFPGGRLAPMAV